MQNDHKETKTFMTYEANQQPYEHKDSQNRHTTLNLKTQIDPWCKVTSDGLSTVKVIFPLFDHFMQ